MNKQKESITQAVIEAGYNYAKDFFENCNIDEETPTLPDGRIDPNYLSIYDAPAEILGWCPDDAVELDPELFPGDYSREEMLRIMESLLEGEEDYLFIEGEKKYITEIYGEDWER